MKLQELLRQNLNSLTPQAVVLIQNQNTMTAQTVVYQPELINLGVILLAYYVQPAKIDKLSKLGDCLLVGHYVQAPRTLKYGRDFANNSSFKALPTKAQKHLTGEIQDCTIAYHRDLHLDSSGQKVNDVKQYVIQHPQLKYVYLYQGQRWYVLRINGQTLNQPINLRHEISQLLQKKA